MVFILLNVTHTQAQDYYRKHIIICVDQTIQGPSRIQTTKNLYNILKDLFCNNTLPNDPNITVKGLQISETEPFFDPNKDQLTLLSSAIIGCGTPTMTYDYKTIHSKCVTSHNNLTDQDLADLVLKKFIHKRGEFHASGMTIDEFIESQMKPLFDGSDVIHSYPKNVSIPSRIYPAVLDFIDASRAATRYEIYIISDFISGDSKGLDQEKERIKALLARNENYYNLFDDYMNNIASPFRYSNEEIKIEYRNVGDKQARIVGDLLMPKAFENVSIGNASGLKIKQASMGSKKFNIETTNIPFMKNEQIQPKQLELTIINKANGNQIYNSIICDDVSSLYHNGYYKIPKMTIELPSVAQDDDLEFQYAFHTSICDKQNKEIIPYIFESPMLISMTEDCFMNPVEKNIVRMILLVGLSLLLVIGLLIWLYIHRGKKAKPKLELDVTPISNTRYMSVEKCEEKNYDCWYMEDSNDRRRIITFHITAKMLKRFLSQKNTYVFKYQIEDLDGNEKFSFRPLDPNPDGTKKLLNTEYPLAKVFDTSQTDSYEEVVKVEAYIDDDAGDIDFSIDNILDVKIKVRVYRQDGKSLTYIGDGEVEREYKFIVRPKLRNSNTWVAFDAGTTGACIAYGVSGNWLDNNDIHLVPTENNTIEGGRTTFIFPSIVAIPNSDKSIAFSDNPIVENFQEGKDFLFTGAGSRTLNVFQSIKKFLGYKSPQTIRRGVLNENGRLIVQQVANISGQDLAHLLVKGMHEQLLKHLQSVNDEVFKGHFHDNLGNFDPQRAIMAVPNNYTRNKVQDMVDTVKRLKVFKEVHYLYESEGVMMTYLRQNLQVIPDKQNRVFVVLDMGGATINLTAFDVKVVMVKNGNIQKIKVNSLAKIGYYVGGDDIDYALIQIFYAIPSIRQAVLNHLGAVDSADQEERLREHQKQHKNELIKIARRAKLDWIDVCNREPKSDNILTDFGIFYTYLQIQFGHLGIDVPDSVENDKSFVEREQREHIMMNEYVFRHITDAITELLRSKRFPKNRSIELILSGRSVLYPNVTTVILDSFRSAGNSLELWRGFLKDAAIDQIIFDDQKVKTAVAEGACWYAMYSRKIELQHNYVTYSYGFEDNSNSQKCFHELIESGKEFDQSGRIYSKPLYGKDLLDPDLNDVKFLQIMGSEADEIVRNDIRLKKNLLDEVKPDKIRTSIDKIVFWVEANGNYDYQVYENGFEVPITKDVTRAQEIQNEIKDENSQAFEFATLNPDDYSESAPDNSTQRTSHNYNNDSTSPNVRSRLR